MENNKNSQKKYKLSPQNKSLYLSVFELIKQDKRPSQISKILKLSPQHLQYYTTLLKKNGLIERVGYGVWATKRSINFHLRGDSKRSIKKVRGHAFIWRVKIDKKFNWLELLKDKNYSLVRGIIPRVIINNKKIWLSKDKILIYENKSFYGINALESRKFAVYELIETLKKLERYFSISLGKYYFKPIKEHFGLIKNELARQCNDKGEKIKISDNLDGDWLWIDDSESLAELETGGRGVTKDRAALNMELQKWWNIKKKYNFEVTDEVILNEFRKSDNRFEAMVSVNKKIEQNMALLTKIVYDISKDKTF